MSDSATVMILKKQIARYTPVDPVVLDMLNLDSRNVVENIVPTLELAIDRIEQLEQASRHLQMALDEYAVQAGDPMFRANLQLCLDQVKQLRR